MTMISTDGPLTITTSTDGLDDSDVQSNDWTRDDSSDANRYSQSSGSAMRASTYIPEEWLDRFRENRYDDTSVGGVLPSTPGSASSNMQVIPIIPKATGPPPPDVIEWNAEDRSEYDPWRSI